MIIYSAIPNRLFPQVAQALAGRYANILQYKEAWIPRNEEFNKANQLGLRENFKKLPTELFEGINFYKKKDCIQNILSVRMMDVFFEKSPSFEQGKESYGLPRIKSKFSDVEFDIVYGVFCPTFIQREKKINDFYFTIIEHPVLYIYNIWNYYTYEVKHNWSPPYSKENNFLLSFVEKYPSIEIFIDTILKEKECIVNNTIEYKFPRYFTNYNLYENFDFIGIADTLESSRKTILYLEKELKIDLFSIVNATNYFNKSSIQVDYIEGENKLYRQKELEDTFTDSVEFYRKNKEKLYKLI